MEPKLEKNLFKLMIPIFVEMALFILMSTIDTLMISNYENTRIYAIGSVAAVGNASTVINLFGVLINVISTGVGVVVSQYLGAKKREEANKTIGTGIIIQIVVGLTLMIILISLGSLLFQLIGTPIEIKDVAYQYLFYGAIGLVFAALTSAMNAGLRSYGKGTTIMVNAGIANIGNFLLNLVFIYGFWFVPEMGVAGASIVTTLMRVITFIISLIFLRRFVGFNILKSRVYPYILRKILKIGIPSALENMTYNILQFVVLSFVNILGTEVVTARTYTSTIASYMYLFSGSFASANSIITGYYIGESDYDSAYKNTNRTVRIAIGVVLTVVLIINIMADPLIALLTKNPIVALQIKNALRVYFLISIGGAFNLVYIQALRSCNDTKFPLIMAVISMLGIGIPAAYLFAIVLDLKLAGIFLGLATDELFRGIMMLYRFRSKKWLKFVEIGG